jgi:hypothetical protein
MHALILCSEHMRLSVFDFEEKEELPFCHQWLSGARFAGTHSLSEQQGCSSDKHNT